MFASRLDFEKHIEDRHLVPFAWHIGDGPKNTSDEVEITRPRNGPDELPRYLLDNQGNQVTPSIRRQEIESSEDRKERRRRLHRILVQRDENAPEDYSDEEPG
jgi:hypothetical protein